jgi:glyoxylase-like metal-dependent hydrolase (beta-lactamase superfamily II)/DNA-binding XRE family transcriptional regulator
MTAFPFEDEFYDVLKKARFGLGLTPETAAERARISIDTLRSLESGDAVNHGEALASLALAYALSPEKLARLAATASAPVPPAVRIPFTRMILGTGFTMNGYLVACPTTRAGFIIDPGFDAPAIEAAVAALHLDPAAILITHGHHDHVGALPEIRARYPVPVIALVEERHHLGDHAAGTTFVRPGHVVEAGTLAGVFRHVPGHTDGMGVIVFAKPGVAFVGDALFARSLGRASAPGAAYQTLLRRVREEILSLPPETILCPGHGPLTTVADEQKLNPFFP